MHDPKVPKPIFGDQRLPIFPDQPEITDVYEDPSRVVLPQTTQKLDLVVTTAISKALSTENFITPDEATARRQQVASLFFFTPELL